MEFFVAAPLIFFMLYFIKDVPVTENYDYYTLPDENYSDYYSDNVTIKNAVDEVTFANMSMNPKSIGNMQ